MSKVAVTNTDYQNVRARIADSVDRAGGLNLSSGNFVVIKINLCSFRMPDTGAVTHPAFLDAFLSYLRRSQEGLKIAVVESDGSESRPDQLVEFHENTKHSRTSVRETRPRLGKPHPYKVYTNLLPIKLPTVFPHPTRNAIECLTEYEAFGGTIDLSTITEILYFAAGATKTIKLPSGKTYDFRAAACTGAQYEIEVYLACGEIEGLTAGVYPFNPFDRSCAAAGENEEIPSARLLLF